jgi:hypothetical protein
VCVISHETSTILHSVGFALNLDDATLQIFHNGAPVHTFTGVTYGLLPTSHFPPTFLNSSSFVLGGDNGRGPVWPCVAARDVGTKLTLVGKKPKIYQFPSLPK